MNRSRITGDLTASGLLYADIANDRVGIGSTIPGNKLSLPDSAKIGLGNAEDLTLFHDGSNAVIDTNTGDLILRSDADDIKILSEDDIVLRDNDDSTNFIECINGGAVKLYNAGNLKLETTSSGATVTGDLVVSANIDLADSTGGSNNRIQLGTGDDLQLYHDGSNGYIYNSGSGNLTLVGNGNNRVQIRAKNGENSITCNSDGNVELYYDNSKKLETTNTGAVVTGILTATTFSGTLNGAVTTTDACQVGDLTILNGNPDLKLKDSNHGGNNTEHIITFQDSSGNNQMNIGSPFGEQHLRIKHGTNELVKIQTDGKVGIGTVTPASLLHTRSGSSNGLMMETPLGSHYIWGIQAAGNLNNGSLAGELGIRGQSGVSISANNGTATQLRITSAGMVGVGVADPAVAGGYHGMEIGGSSNSALRLSTTVVSGWAFTDYEADGTQKFIAGMKGSSNAEICSWRIATGASLDSNIKLHVTESGKIGIGDWGNNTLPQTLSLKGNMYMRQGDVITWNNGDCQIGGVSGYHFVISTYNGSSMTEKLRVTSTGAIQNYYNTSLPVTDSRPILQLGYGVIGDDNSGYNAVTCNAYPVSGDSSWHYIGSSSLGASRYHIGFGDHKWFTAAAGTRGNDITWSERLRINSSGDLKHTGLRSGNSQNKLAILTTPSYNTGEEDVIIYQAENETSSNQLTIGGGTGSYNATTTLRFLTASAVNTTGGEERLRITSDGKVGINYAATPPAEDLMVRGAGSTGAITIQHLSGGNSYGARMITRGSTNTGFKIATQFNSAYNEKIEMNGNGQVVISLSGDTNQSTAWPLNITSTGSYNGTYPGLCIKSTSTGGGNGFSMVAFDGNWGLYTNSGNRNGLAILDGTSASSANAKVVIGTDGVTTIGKDAYSYTHTSRYGGASLHVVKGSLSIGGTGGTANAYRGGVYQLGWYITVHAAANYYHLKTDLWAGGSPHGNNEYIMGGFRIEGYSYSSPTGSATAWVQFHNWGGGYPGLSIKSHYAGWNMGATVYTSSDGYVVLRVDGGTYKSHVIDLIQHIHYPSRDINVTSTATNNNATHF